MIYIKCSARSLQVENSTDVSFSHYLMSSTCCFWPLASDLPASSQHKEDVSDQSSSWPLEACRTLLPVTAGRHWRARASSHRASRTFFHLCFLSLDPACLHSQLSRSIYSAGNKICSAPHPASAFPLKPSPPHHAPQRVKSWNQQAQGQGMLPASPDDGKQQLAGQYLQHKDLAFAHLVTLVPPSPSRPQDDPCSQHLVSASRDPSSQASAFPPRRPATYLQLDLVTLNLIQSTASL